MLRKYLFLTAITAAFTLTGCPGVDLDDNDKNNGSNNGEIVEVDPQGIGGEGAGPDARVARVIYFDYDSYVVKDEFRPTVSANAQYLRSNPSARVVLEGHTDERGTSEYNLALGQKRAEATRQTMLLLGVPESQIEAVSYGKERPADYGSTESSWSQNRRVEFSYR